jgi:hypothetical protein
MQPPSGAIPGKVKPLAFRLVMFRGEGPAEPMETPTPREGRGTGSTHLDPAGGMIAPRPKHS